MPRHLRLRSTSSLGLVLLVLLGAADRAMATADGFLDTSFHTTGMFHEGSPGTLRGEGALAAPDGALVLFGSYQSSGAVDYAHWRRVTDVGLDAACNTKPSTQAAFEILDGAFDLQGRLLLVGQLGGDPVALMVARYLYPACTPDTSFNGDGFISLQLDRDLRAFGVGVQGSGKIVVAANYFANPANGVLLARFSDTGILDGTFGDGGYAIYDPVGTYEYGYAMKLDGLDRPVVAGGTKTSIDTDDDSMFGLRFTVDGDPDNSFAGDGSRVVAIHLIVEGSANAYGVAIAPDNRVALLGYAEAAGGWSPAVVVLTAGGNPDPAFDGDGVGSYWAAGASQQIFLTDGVFQGDGRLLVSGAWTQPAGDPKSAMVMRLKADGSMDGTFGFFATALYDFDLGGGDDDIASGLALENGRVVLAGTTNRDASNDDGFLIRLANGYIFADGAEGGNFHAWSVHP
jgi:uncharacterized delta-60 repeat protein